jgi:hypothetical protein
MLRPIHVIVLTLGLLACPKTSEPSKTATSPKIGGPCKPEDGWQYKYPDGWPAGPVDSSTPVANTPPANFIEDFQLPAGIKYCVTRLLWRPNGFFTSNCKSDGDCPGGSRCNGSWCDAPCTSDAQCESGLYCPSSDGVRFCREGCPVGVPSEGYYCYHYGGPPLCRYQEQEESDIACQCVPQPMNSAVWQCRSTADAGTMNRCPATAPASLSGVVCGGIASPLAYPGSVCAWPVDAGVLTCRCTLQAFNAYTWECDGAKDAAAPEVAMPNAAEPRLACSKNDDCLLVNWGCCEDACQDGLDFTLAVNRAFESTVTRVSQCGKVCSAKSDCGLNLSAACDEGKCAVRCADRPCPARGGPSADAASGSFSTD